MIRQFDISHVFVFNTQVNKVNMKKWVKWGKPQGQWFLRGDHHVFCGMIGGPSYLRPHASLNECGSWLCEYYNYVEQLLCYSQVFIQHWNCVTWYRTCSDSCDRDDDCKIRRARRCRFREKLNAIYLDSWSSRNNETNDVCTCSLAACQVFRVCQPLSRILWT